jgi:hypothetical protein
MFWIIVAVGMVVLLGAMWLVDRKRKSRVVRDPSRQKSEGHLLGEDPNLYR